VVEGTGLNVTKEGEKKNDSAKRLKKLKIFNQGGRIHEVGSVLEKKSTSSQKKRKKKRGERLRKQKCLKLRGLGSQPVGGK